MPKTRIEMGCVRGWVWVWVWVYLCLFVCVSNIHLCGCALPAQLRSLLHSHNLTVFFFLFTCCCFVQSKSAVTFDGKRDQWASYDVRQHKKVIEEFEKVGTSTHGQHALVAQ